MHSMNLMNIIPEVPSSYGGFPSSTHIALPPTSSGPGSPKVRQVAKPESEHADMVPASRGRRKDKRETWEHRYVLATRQEDSGRSCSVVRERDYRTCPRSIWIRIPSPDVPSFGPASVPLIRKRILFHTDALCAEIAPVFLRLHPSGNRCRLPGIFAVRPISRHDIRAY